MTEEERQRTAREIRDHIRATTSGPLVDERGKVVHCCDCGSRARVFAATAATREASRAKAPDALCARCCAERAVAG